MGQYCSWVMGFLLPSLWEAEVAVSAAALLVAAALLLFLDQTTPKNSAAGDASASHSPTATATSYRHRDEGRGRSCAKGKTSTVAQVGGTSKIALPAAGGSHSRDDASSNVIKLELLSAKYLIGANLNGTSDPYAVISCGEQRRFSSMVPSSRNPLWGQEFNFLVKELPAEVTITVYDWDNVCKCKVIGSVNVAILGEDKTGATWYDLDNKSGQICLRVNSTKVFPAADSFFDQCNGVESQREIMLNMQRLAMTEDSGPLQDTFEAPHDEVIHHSYSCALERCFLHHGRLSISSWHLCFHSNVFSKQLNVIIPLQDIDEIKRSQHSLINPAITIFLHTGAGGHGAPPSCSQNGRVRYKFTSFWHRNRTIRALETALQNYRATLEAEKRVRTHSHLQSGSINVTNSKTDSIKTEEKIIAQAITFQPFINEHVLVDVTSNSFPGTSEKFFSIILGDNSMFFQKYRDARKDTNLKLSKWFVSDEYGGSVREVTFRSLCHSPLCPPDTAVTEWQHASFSKDKRNLIYETKHQAHDVPFGSYFENSAATEFCKPKTGITEGPHPSMPSYLRIHCRWSVRTTSNSTCQVDIKIGVNMKKWCILQSKIKSGATDEYRKEVCKILEAACNYVLILRAESNGQGSDDIVAPSSA